MLLSVLVPCHAGEEVGGGEPEPAPPFAADELEGAGLPQPAPPFAAHGPEDEAEPQPAVSDEVDAIIPVKIAVADFPDEILRCEIPSCHAPQVPTHRAFAGINSPDICQKLCVLNKKCDFVEWDFITGVCSLKVVISQGSSVSPATPGRTAVEDLGRRVSTSSLVSAFQEGEACEECLKKYHEEGSSVTPGGSEGSYSTFIAGEKPSFLSSSSSTFASIGDRILFPSTSPVPSKLSSLAHFSASSPSSPSKNRVGAHSPPMVEVAVPSVSALQSSAVKTPEPVQTGEQDLVIVLEELVVPHDRKIVLPPTCGVTCWISNYICSHVSPPQGSPEAAGQREKATVPRKGVRSQLYKFSRKSGLPYIGGFSPGENEPSNSPHDCQRRCQRDEDCGAFSWNRYSYQCHFCPAATYPMRSWTDRKAFFAAAESNLTLDFAHITGPKESCTVSGPTEWVTPVFQPCFHANKTTQSSSVLVIETVPSIPSVSDCQHQCYMKPTCHHFTWNYSTHECELRAGPIHNSLVSARPFIAGPKSCFKGCLKNNLKYPKGSVIATVKADTIFDCQVACAAQISPRCEGVTYYFATHECDLASTTSLPSSSLPSTHQMSSSWSPPSAARLASTSIASQQQKASATNQQQLPQTNPSFIGKEASKSTVTLQPDVPCTMCVSATASLCQLALPEALHARRSGTNAKRTSRWRGKPQ